MKIAEFTLAFVFSFTILGGISIQDGKVENKSYKELLDTWKSVEEISEWIGKNFTYDMEKALRVSLAENRDSRSSQILSPEQFVIEKKGICVDLARFGYETLKKISPELNPSYLMIEFEPIERADSVLRLHWLVLYQQDGKYYSVADSNRPGVIAGPFESVEVLIKTYEEFRERKVVSFKILESYKKSQNKKSSKQIK